MKDNYMADVSHTDDFEQMYQEMVKQAEDKYNVKSEHPKTEEEAKDFAAKVLGVKEEIPIPDNYEVWDDKGNVIHTSKIIIREKKKEYPQSYNECCKVLGISTNRIFVLTDYDTASEYEKKQRNLLSAFKGLLTCRDAYWKIAGEEMGLGKLWKPDWNAKDNHFYTIHTFNGKIECSATAHRNAVLIFPTEEMRDGFYENFKELINEVKELL